VGRSSRALWVSVSDHQHRGSVRVLVSNVCDAKRPRTQQDRIARVPVGNGTLERWWIGRRPSSRSSLNMDAIRFPFPGTERRT
jgi:hypothetical protein